MTRTKHNRARARFLAILPRAAVLSALLLSTALGDPQREIDMGFFFSRSETVDGTVRTRALGPLYEQQASDDGLSFRAVRPLFSYLRDDRRQRALTEVLWPVGMFKDLGTDRHWRFFPAFGNDYDSADFESRSRLSVLPFLFAGRDKNGERYFGLFPLGGTVREIIGFDRADFVMFPLYGHTLINDVEGHTILWPFISWASGGDVERFRIFPFYGKSINRDRWTKRFVCWPFWNSVDYHEEGARGGGYIFFPFYGHIKTQETETRWVLPPLFKHSKSGDTSILYCPWPLVQLQHGDIEKFYLWPLWGRKTVGNVDSAFFLWPISEVQTVTRSDTKRRSAKVLPFFFYEEMIALDERGEPAVTDLPPMKRWFKIWPLFSYLRRGEASRLRVPDLWPARDVRSVEVNYAPLWTLYRRTTFEDASETEILWGLYRGHTIGNDYRHRSLFPLFETEYHSGRLEEKGGPLRRWAVLKGLFGYRRTPEDRELQLLYFLKFGGDREPGEETDENA